MPHFVLLPSACLFFIKTTTTKQPQNLENLWFGGQHMKAFPQQVLGADFAWLSGTFLSHPVHCQLPFHKAFGDRQVCIYSSFPSMSFLGPTYNFWWQFNSFYQLQPYLLLCCCCRGGGYTRHCCPQCLLSLPVRLFLFILSLAFIFLPLKDRRGYAKLFLSSAALCFQQLCGNGLLLRSSPFSPCVHFLYTIAASQLPAFGSTDHPALMNSLVQKMKRFGVLGVLLGAGGSQLLAVRPLWPGSSALHLTG